ncbi:MAG: hypothetical protein GX621_03640 [Pirellulaceae bacterium]|nr:hypothetical protein [Pirellulaceae bacterium]
MKTCIARHSAIGRLALVCAVSALVLAAVPARAVVVMGHRGASTLAPENTLAAVEASIGHAWGAESDTRLTSDGVPIIMHDPEVDRTTDGAYSGNVADLTFAQIRSLDAGSWFSRKFAGEQVPTLTEEITASIAGGMIACVQLATDASTMSQYLPYLQPYQNQIEVSSFSWSDSAPVLQTLDALDPGFTLVALGSGSLASKLATLPSCIDKVSWSYSGITQASLDAAHAMGLQVYAYTVDDPATMLALEAMGVDGIVTNYPQLATAVLNKPPPQPPVVGEGLPRKLHDKLLMNWSFDDALGGPAPITAVDSVNGVDATLGVNMSEFTSWQTAPNAKLGGALNFDGTNDDAWVPPDIATMPSDNAVTVATWVKLDVLPSGMDESYGSIYDSDSDAYVLYLEKSSNELRFKVTVGGTAARPGIPAASLNTTAWHFVTAVYDGGAGVARIYLNGNLVDVHADDGTGSDGLVGAVGLQSAFFGRNGTAKSGYFDGKIDETAVWGRALGEAEIAYLYNNGAGRTVQSSNPTVEAVTPVVRLEFEGDLANQGAGGAAYNGQWINGASGQAFFEAGMNGQSLRLQNPRTPTGGDAVSIPVTLANSGTISFWCKPDSFYDQQTLFDNSSNGDNWEMWISAAGVAVFRLESGSEVLCNLNALDGSDHWYHMAVTWFKAGSTAVLNLYVDGVLRDVDEGAWVAPGSAVYIGGGNAANDFANATFDDFRIYDTMLTTDEIEAIFTHKEAGVPGDANGDGRVDDLDARRLADNWGATGANRLMGDFDGDGVVGPADASILAANWGADRSDGREAAAVPEPSVTVITLLFLCCGVPFGGRRGKGGR